MRRAAGVLYLLLAGCATASIEDAVPPGALSAAAEDVPAPAAREPAGSYPDLSAEPAAAAPQITEAHRASETAALRARRDRLAGNGGAAAAANPEELRRLARRHAKETLKEIEGE